jgi:2-oxoglutarate ferredoxin oxidoreductase subunit alpha
MKNIMYVGVLAALLDMDMQVIKGLLNEQFAAKASLLDANQKAIDLGYAWAKENFSCPLPLRTVRWTDARSHHDRRQYHLGAGLRLCGCDSRRVVPDHAIDLDHGQLQELL